VVEERSSATEPGRRGRPRARIARVAAGLTAVNVVGAASGLISGPLLARALGVSGRGDLAAITVPFAFIPGVLGLGLPAYAYRALPRGAAPDEVLGSLGLPLILLGLLSVAAAVPIADGLAGGRPAVRTFLIVGFMSAPILLLNSLLYSMLGAMQRWRRVAVTSITPFAVPFLAIVVLYTAGRLTVAAAAAATIAGAVLSVIPGLMLLRSHRPRFRRAVTREGAAFGLKAWVGGLALTANARLDQFLMITVVAPRILGLYAVATTLSGASGLVAGALGPPLMGRIAAGETRLMGQASRIMVAATILLNVPLAIVTPKLLVLLFGSGFRDATPMVLILLGAQVPMAGAAVLSSALQADGAPLIPTIAELLAVVVTIVGLILVLAPLGGVGAAIVSLAAYGSSFAFQVTMAHRRTGIAVARFLVPTRADVRWARELVPVMALRPRPSS
jgi:O-antigen/teichoic acid export membrane protein